MENKIVTERSVVVEVLKLYRQLPYLWNATHKLYTNKIARREGMEMLLKIWRKLEPDADIQCIRKKLNNWRAAYRRERNKLGASDHTVLNSVTEQITSSKRMKTALISCVIRVGVFKIADSMRIATETDEIHKPNLWYYNHLTFIHDDCPVLSNDDATDDQDVKFVIEDGDEDSNDDVHDRDGADDTDEESGEEPEKKLCMSTKRKSREVSSKREQRADPVPAQVMMSSNDENSADLLGRAIGSQLKEVSKYQRCLAEKLISEIMFYAKLEQLTIGTTIMLEPTNSMPT